MKAFADDKIKLANMIIFAFDGVENIVGKGENAGYQNFSFSNNFLKSLSLGVVKSRDCVVEFPIKTLVCCGNKSGKY